MLYIWNLYNSINQLHLNFKEANGREKRQKKFYIMILAMVTWLHTFVKIHQTVHFKLSTFISSKLYLNKADDL